MRKRALMVGVILFLTVAWCLNAHAAWVTYNKKPVTAWQGFQNSVGGALYNAMPWNWGKR
jgi:hypothetical protein